jgi:glycosyltransferase involved in cell wall biosynthesis
MNTAGRQSGDAAPRTIGLSMIVKDEAHVILRCLASVRPLVDYVLVVDTGSTDGTQRLIRDYLAGDGLPGAVVDEPWQDFAYNRTSALEQLRRVAGVDYALVIDADDLLELDQGFDPQAFKARMQHDLYDVEVVHDGIRHLRPHLFRNHLPFTFKGVVHEYLAAPPGQLERTRANGFRVKIVGGGARSHNPGKFDDDAALIERTLASETDPSLIARYTFYLAQSYRDSGNREKALENYLKRAELGYWQEEVYVGLYEAGNLMAALGRPFDEVIAPWLRAAGIAPARAEALHALSHYCRQHGRNQAGFEYAGRGIELPLPGGALFAQPWIYDYGLLEEYAINAHGAGHYRQSLDASLRLLGNPKLPEETRVSIAANARFAAEKLSAATPLDLGSLGKESFLDQHRLAPPRPLRARLAGPPRILLAIPATQNEAELPLYLDCIEALDYPKSAIVLDIRTNNSTDRTELLLRDWVARVGHLYGGVEFGAAALGPPGEIRDKSLARAWALDCDFYFVADCDNFLRQATLRELVALNLPVVAPLLRPVIAEALYSNFHAEIDAQGYYRRCDQYFWILSRRVRGLMEVPVVHGTYLVRADVIPDLTYRDGTGRHAFVIFSESARRTGIPQYLDNRQLYGYITFAEGQLHTDGDIDRARALLQTRE